MKVFSTTARRAIAVAAAAVAGLAISTAAYAATSSGCDPVNSAAYLRVYPPNQRSATLAAFSFEACSHAGPVWMSITEPITSGVGTIYG